MEHLHWRSLQSKTVDDSDTQQSLLYIYGLNEYESWEKMIRIENIYKSFGMQPPS